ncbi:MAG: hypothetical protein R3B48_10235 [Kofleriaceae bacterium]
MTQPPAFSRRLAPLALSAALVEELARAYGDPPRAYHHLGHVDEVVGWYDWVDARAPWARPREVFTAVLFHDAVYVPGAADNEARSAALAARSIATHDELAGVDAARVQELIGWTARHGQLAVADVDAEAARFLDCDLAILGAPQERYRSYREEIAREYAALPAQAYRAGRRRFVQALRARPRLFLSELFHAELDAAARANLAQEDAELA